MGIQNAGADYLRYFAGRRRRTGKAAARGELCLDYGVRVQYSVFECDIAPDQWVVLKDKLLKTYNPETDSLRFYHLGSKWRRKVEHHGAKPAVDVFKDTLIV